MRPVATSAPCLFKMHRTSIQSGAVASAWTDCTNFGEVSEETVGNCAELNADNKTVDILKTGYYHFGGCLHCQNNTAGIFTGITVLSRLYQNGTTELRCSQRGYVIDLVASGEDVLSYNGTAYLEEGDSLVLQYYTDNANLDFFSNAAFANQIAYTFWLAKI